MSVPSRRSSAPLLELGVPLAVLVIHGFLALRARQFVLVDDAYIALRYAVNAANGLGLVWNAGERVEGYTNPLWVLLLAALSKTPFDLPMLAALGSLGFAAATLVLLHRASRSDSSTVERLLPGLFLAANASYANAATSGMESAAFGFFVLAGTLRVVRAETDLRGAVVPFALAYLSRPEGALAVAVVLFTFVATAAGPFALRLRRAAPLALAMAALVGAHVALRHSYYGTFLPNTFYAKVIFGKMTLLRGAFHVVGFLVAGGWIVLPGLRELRRAPRDPLLVHGYALLGAFLPYLLAVGGDHPFWYRFYVPLLPLPVLATSRVVARWLARKLGTDRRRMTVAGAVALAAGALGEPLAEPHDLVGRVDPFFARSMEDVRRFFVLEAPPGSLVAAEAVGHVGFHAPHVRILDMWGLNDAHIAHLDVPPTTKFGHDKFDWPYVIAQQPDYLYLLLPTLEVPPIPGYVACWPSRSFPVGVYRRNFALLPGDAQRGVPRETTRSLAPPPPCRPPPPGSRLP